MSFRFLPVPSLLCGALGALLPAGLAPAAQAQQPSPRSEAEGRSPPGRTGQRLSGAAGTARYEDSVSQRRFVLERSESGALLKLDDSPEVLSLRATTAQRGDAFLRSDAGRLVLRVTELGNVISYLSDEDGAPADMAGLAAPLDAPAMTASLTDHVRAISRRLTARLGQDVTVFGAGAFAREEAWAADALNVAAIGVDRAHEAFVSAGREASDNIRLLRTLRLVRSAEASAVYRDGELLIGVNPEKGYAGRPSSEAIAILLADN